MNETNPKYNKNAIEEKYICKVCGEIYKNAHQAECGDRYCLSCLVEQVKKGVCLICHEKISEEKIPDKAFQKEINNMEIQCVDCDWAGKFIDYRVHYKTHEKIICAFCKKSFLDEAQLDEHLDEEKGTCELIVFKCHYSKIGCNHTAEYSRKTIQEHNKSEVASHVKMVFNDLEPRVSRLEHYYQSSNASNQVPTSLSSPNESLISTFDEVGPMVKNTGNKNKLSDTAATNKKAKSSDSSEDANSKLVKVEYNIKCVSDDMAKCIHSTEKLTKDFEESKANEKKLKEEVENLTKSLTFAQATIISLEERLLAQEKTSYNGTLVWKITNCREKIQEAKSGRQTSIYSTPFYTHPCGFRMCGRVYLNGDGMGRNTHVSLFFVIMRGEYDALLRWPFRQKVTFMLLDQSTNESKENVIDAFRPDPNSNSFKRPNSDMNIASGIPLFCPLAKLHSNEHEYIKDDCIFIKIIVDSRDLIDI